MPIKLIKRYSLIIALLALVFFALYLFSAGTTWMRVGPVFSMPDENVNYFFTRLYAEQDKLQYFEPLNDLAQEKIHPRSFNVVDGSLVPVGFLGLILLYGGLAKVFGLVILPFLTPLLAVLAVIAFYFLLKKIFKQPTAFLASIFLFILPAFFYYASKSMVPNVLFICLIIFGILGLVSAYSAKQAGLNRNILIIAAGFLIGLGLTVRTIEIFWLLPLLLLAGIFFYKRVGVRWYQVAMFVLMLIIAFVPMLFFNQQIYGHWWATGYASFSNSGVGEIISTSNSEIMDSTNQAAFSSFLFPFGLNFKNIAINFYHYIIVFNWWLFVPFLVGIIFFIYRYKKKSTNQKFYFWLFAAVFIWLNLFYGSWRFFDNPDPSQYSIGTSYVRYFLPIYIMSLPFVVMGLSFIYRLLTKVDRLWGRLLFLFMIAFILWHSIWLVFYQQKDSLVPLSKTIVEYRIRQEKLFATVPEDAVILARRAEKFLYPVRKVIFYTDEDPEIKSVIKQLLEKRVSVYYFGMIGEEDGPLMEKKFKEEDILFVEKEKIYKEELLYQLIINDEQTRKKEGTSACCGCR